MRINLLLFVALVSGASTQSAVGGATGYFYPEPSPSFTLPPPEKPTTRPPPPPPPTTPPADYLPPATTTRPSYAVCFGAQQCITSQACTQRGGSSSSNQPCEISAGSLGVCCTPAPATTPAPTTVPVRTTTQPSYAFCTGNQDCITSQACTARGSIASSSQACQSRSGELGVCCNPVPVTTTTTPRPTTTQPSYAFCTGNQDCITSQACTARGSIASSSQACQSLNGGLGVCCNPPVTTTTRAPTTVPVRTTTQPSYAYCTGAQQCIASQACTQRGSTIASSQACQIESPSGGLGVCCNPVPVTTTTTTTPRPTQPSYISCTGSQQCITSQACTQRGSTSASSQTCQSSSGSLGICCNPAPTTTTARPTTAVPVRTTTAPSLEYLPPVEPEDPIQVPDSNNENVDFVVTVKPPVPTPPRTTTTRPTRPTTQAVVLSPEEEEILFWDFRESIPGDPETDYPILDKIPVTSFTCKGKLDGFYADPETRCQVFHVCANIPDADPIQSSFLCPNGTLFNQEVFVCQWWPDVNCASSAQFYSLNSNIGKVPEGAASSGVKISVSGQSGNSHGASAQAGSFISAGSHGSVSASAGVAVSSNY